MDKVKIKNIKTGAVTEVKKALADDFIGTGDFELFEEKKQEVEEIKPKNNSFRKEE